MKKLKILTAVCAVLLFSCQVDNEELVNTTNADLIVENANINGTFSSNSNSNGNPLYGSRTSEDLLQSLRWASYTIANILHHHPNLRNAASPYMDPISKTIPMEVLLGPNSPVTGFKAKFIQVLENYAACTRNSAKAEACPDTSNSPGPPVCPTCNLNSGEGQVMIDYLIGSNCTEVYFPRGFEFSVSDFVTTTGHPLNENYFNDGFTMDGSNEPPIVTVSPNFIQINNHTTIAVRPVREGTAESICSYLEYPVADFTDFLEGSW